MSILKHAFTNSKSDGGDATVTRPSDWNAEHATTETDTSKRLAPDGAGGMAWVSGAGTILGYHNSSIGSDKTNTGSGGSTPLDIGPTVTFTAPASGAVLVSFTGNVVLTSGFTFYWQVRESTTVVVEGIIQSGGTNTLLAHMELVVTGLTGGSSHTYKMSQRTDGGGTMVTKNFQPVVMKVVQL